MKYSTKELRDLARRSLELTYCQDDSKDQYRRDRCATIVRHSSDLLIQLQEICIDNEYDLLSAYNFLVHELEADIDYYYKRCKTLSKGEW